MQDTTTESVDRFFFCGQWRTVAIIGICAWSLFAFTNLVEEMTVGSAIEFILPLFWGWMIWWRSSRFPIITVSNEAVEWGISWFQHAKRVTMTDVLHITVSHKPTSTPLGLQTHSSDTVWVSLWALSAADRRNVREAIARRLEPA